jgi:hypothetical protein
MFVIPSEVEDSLISIQAGMKLKDVSTSLDVTGIAFNPVEILDNPC